MKSKEIKLCGPSLFNILWIMANPWTRLFAQDVWHKSQNKNLNKIRKTEKIPVLRSCGIPHPGILTSVKNFDYDDDIKQVTVKVTLIQFSIADSKQLEYQIPATWKAFGKKINLIFIRNIIKEKATWLKFWTILKKKDMLVISMISLSRLFKFKVVEKGLHGSTSTKKPSKKPTPSLTNNYNIKI